MGVEESKVENYLRDQVHGLHPDALCRPWKNKRNEPDRICLLPGYVCFVEVKTMKGRLSPGQRRELIRFSKLGLPAYTVYGRCGVNLLIEEFREKMDITAINTDPKIIEVRCL